ncbi:MAG: helix-turn-helix domain-containing protein [Thermoleophilia bacterium]|nr:helix-turn-helix domain-containing protein [Thermoleophilia bacterium]
MSVNPDLDHLEPPLLSISSAAHLLSMSESTVRRLIDEDVIATVIVRGSVRIRRGELDPWLGAWSPVPVSATPAGGRPPEPGYVVKSRYVGPGSGPESPNVPRGGVRPKAQAELERRVREASRLERTGPTVAAYSAEPEAMHPSMRYVDLNPDYDEPEADLDRIVRDHADVLGLPPAVDQAAETDAAAPAAAPRTVASRSMTATARDRAEIDRLAALTVEARR